LSGGEGARVFGPEDYSQFLSRLDGIESHVIVDEEGFPLDFSGVSKEEAESHAALAVDLVTIVGEHARELIGEAGGNEVIVDAGEGKIIDVVRAREILALVKGARQPAEEAARTIALASEGHEISCPNCGANLTLEVSKCPSCGKAIPFTSPHCPHCGADTRFKQCPKCGALVSYRGRRVVKKRSPRSLDLAAVEGGIGAAMFGALAFAAGASTGVAVAVALLGGLAVGAAVYVLGGEEELVEEA